MNRTNASAVEKEISEPIAQALHEGKAKLAIVPTQEPSVALMLQQVITSGITTENVSALEQMVGLYERMQDRDAKKSFNAAFATLQSEMPQIAATRPVPNRDGTLRYKFAPFEEIMDQVQPLLTKHGFSISFNSRVAEARMIAVCNLRHISGHAESNEFAVRIGSGPPGATETQADGAAKTYAKRGAMCDCLNIAIDHDDDARGSGKAVGKAIAEDLEKRCKDAKVDVAKFLKFAGADSFENISDDRFEALDAMLTKKEMGAGLKDKEGKWLW